MRKRWTIFWICVAVSSALIGMVTAAHAADDTRFYGTWTTTTLYNGQMVTIVSVHDASGFKNYVRLPSGDTPAGDGTFSAANGKWTSNAAPPNNVGIYHFITNDTVIATNAAGQIVNWIRDKTAAKGPVDDNTAALRTTGYIPPTDRPGNAVTPPAAPPSAKVPQPVAQASDADVSLSPGVRAGMVALQRKDYTTAWRDFMAEAQKGDADGEAAVGSMLFQKTNPPGTGFYAQCEKWLLASANQDNEHGMDMLAQYYFNEGKNIAGGINPGVNNASIPPQLQQQAEGKFKLARQWFEKSAAKGDIYAMGNLAIMLDSGTGGPRDPNRAAELRAGVKKGPDAGFAKRATADPNNMATSAAWQAGHYADAVKSAEASAAKGDANAQALLGRAYYEGLGVQRNDQTALFWAQKAADANNRDGLYYLGRMYENGRGVRRNLTQAVTLLKRASDLGQMEAKSELGGIATALGQGASDGPQGMCAKGLPDSLGSCIDLETGGRVDPGTGKPIN